MALSHEVHAGFMSEVSSSVHTALLLSILLTEVRRAMAARDEPARATSVRDEPADMPSVVALANLAARLHQAPPSRSLSLRHKSHDPSKLHDDAMAIAGRVANKMVDVGLGAPSFAAATFRIARLGGAADTIEGLLYAALTCLQACLLGARHAQNGEIYMLLLALVVYPGLEPLHPANIGALGDRSRHVAPLVLVCVQQCLRLMLSQERQPAQMTACLKACVECRGALGAHLPHAGAADLRPIPEVIRALDDKIAATLDMLHHFSEL